MFLWKPFFFSLKYRISLFPMYNYPESSWHYLKPTCDLRVKIPSLFNKRQANYSIKGKDFHFPDLKPKIKQFLSSLLVMIYLIFNIHRETTSLMQDL